MWLVLPAERHFTMVVYQKTTLSAMLLNDLELTVFLSLSFFTPPSFCRLDCPSFAFSPLGWTLCPCAPRLLLLLLLSAQA